MLSAVLLIPIEVSELNPVIVTHSPSTVPVDSWLVTSDPLTNNLPCVPLVPVPTQTLKEVLIGVELKL